MLKMGGIVICTSVGDWSKDMLLQHSAIATRRAAAQSRSMRSSSQFLSISFEWPCSTIRRHLPPGSS